ncbi:hypothetical protein EDC04DRAFT_1807292 [Pisolithus marmoratus]|nr:hypothetical protein EDC04DRAFT_1807292 [Pisolithus marmoratus]
MTLISDANIRECFDVIHSEVVLVWNFSDPFQYLSSGRFRELMKNLAGVDRSTLQSTLLPCSEVTNPSADSRVSLTASARIVQPFKAVLATVQSVHKAYQRSPNVHHMFMAYFVDLVHVLEILFALTINNSKQLTRGAISLAFDVYYQSEMRRNAHLRIKDFDYKIPARNAVFEKILSLVGSSPIEEEDIFKALQSTPPEDLERDKEWYVDDDKPEREKRLASLAGLVSDLDVQFRKEGGMDVLTDIIALQRTILDLMPRWHRERLASIVNLANFLNERFRMESGAEDLTQIIALRRAALERTPPGHQDRVLSVVNLANSLHERFKRESGMEDLMQAITLRYTALELTPVGRQSHRRSLVDLANSLHERYKREGGIENLTEIITLRRAAWKLTPPEHSDYPVSLVDLLDSLDERFSRDGGSEDLAEIINLRRAALQLTPLGHQGRFESLVNLSNRLHERFRKIDTLEDLNEIITLCRAALECAPPTALPPSNRCTFLLHLADCLCEKYRRLSVEAELTEAIKHACTTLVLCPSDHRDYVSCRDCLAKCVGLKTTKWRVPPPMSSVQQTVWYIAMETTKTFPLRLLNTRTGIVCNRDAQLSCFMDSAQYNELLTSMQDDLERKVRNAVLKFFRYTILSHRWGSGEPLLRDIERKNIYTLEDREGIAKLQNFCILALQHGYAWAWSDTCCIDKDSSLELQEAIASMFSWYRNSALTIVHLSDVPDIQSFTKSAWFSRGWTLQELLASPQVLFYMQDWSLYADSASWNHKVDNDVLTRLQEATGIGESHLTNFSPGVDDARSRLRWASTRSTTRPEDAAYSLFGIFGIHLPVLYGETVENALGRLLAEIISQSGDTSVLDWIGKESSFHSCLPADLTPYQTVPRIQSTPSDLTDHIDIDIEKARQMYSALTQLPSPRFFPGRRLVLPCIVHRITGVKLLETSSSTSHHTYKIVASGLVPLELTLSSRLQQGSGANLPYALIRPWNRKLLDPPAHGNDVLGGLLEWLRKPFNALLLKTLHNEYKRIPSDDPIGARVKDLASIDIDIECQTLEIV